MERPSFCANLLVVRERVHAEKKIEQLAKALDVTLGENSMLLTITAHEDEPDYEPSQVRERPVPRSA